MQLEGDQNQIQCFLVVKTKTHNLEILMSSQLLSVTRSPSPYSCFWKAHLLSYTWMSGLRVKVGDYISFLGSQNFKQEVWPGNMRLCLSPSDSSSQFVSCCGSKSRQPHRQWRGIKARKPHTQVLRWNHSTLAQRQTTTNQGNISNLTFRRL